MIKKDFAKNFTYTWEHKKAFLKVEKELLGRNTLSGYLHDADKLVLYLFFDKKRAGEIHRKHSRHHQNSKHKSRLKYQIQTIIDFECSSLTKKDKPYSAREFVVEVCPQLKEEYLPIIEMLGL
ncbi:MAG: hypothetical protein ACRCZZ_04185 [Phocaeicola sp.]